MNISWNHSISIDANKLINLKIESENFRSIIKPTFWFVKITFGWNQNWALQNYFPRAPAILEKLKETAEAIVKSDFPIDSKCQWIARETIASLLMPTNW